MKKRILLVGDTIIDRSHYLNPTGFSLESPTIRCTKISSLNEFGGAANVAREFDKRDCDVTFMTSISEDMIELLEKQTDSRVIAVSNRNQIKERFYLVRESTYKYLQINDTSTITYDSANVDFSAFDLIVLSDYRLGMVTRRIVESMPADKLICQMQKSDSSEGLDKFAGAHAIIGNQYEIPTESIDSLYDSLSLKLIVATRGKDSIIFRSCQQKSEIQVPKVEMKREVHGAGDSFLAGFCSMYNPTQANTEIAIKSGIDAASKFLGRGHGI